MRSGLERSRCQTEPGLTDSSEPNGAEVGSYRTVRNRTIVGPPYHSFSQDFEFHAYSQDFEFPDLLIFE